MHLLAVFYTILLLTLTLAALWLFQAWKTTKEDLYKHCFFLCALITLFTALLVLVAYPLSNATGFGFMEVNSGDLRYYFFVYSFINFFSAFAIFAARLFLNTLILYNLLLLAYYCSGQQVPKKLKLWFIGLAGGMLLWLLAKNVLLPAILGLFGHDPSQKVLYPAILDFFFMETSLFPMYSAVSLFWFYLRKRNPTHNLVRVGNRLFLITLVYGIAALIFWLLMHFYLQATLQATTLAILDHIFTGPLLPTSFGGFILVRHFHLSRRTEATQANLEQLSQATEAARPFCFNEAELPTSLISAFQLTKRESEICVLKAQGMSSKDICQKLDISASTAKNHAHNCFKKLNIQTRYELLELIRQHQHVQV